MKNIFRKRRRGGNGDSGRQWFYILLNIPFIFVIKQGITRDRLWDRIREINNDSPMTVDVPIFILKVRWAWNIERMFKRGINRLPLLTWIACNWFSGTGKTERFYIILLPFSIVAVLVVFLIEWGIYFGIVIGFFYLLTLIK